MKYVHVCIQILYRCFHFVGVVSFLYFAKFMRKPKYVYTHNI